MKVFISIGTHPQYKELVDYPPKGVRYQVEGKSEAKLYYSNELKNTRERTNKIIKVFGIPRLAYYKTNADLIFSTRGIIPLNAKPWVAELEHPYAFAGMDYRNWGIRQKLWVKWFLSRKNCKKVMLNSHGAYSALENSFDISKIKDKLEVVYLTVHYKKIRKIRHDTLNLLTITSEVYQRGFNLMKEIYPALKKKYKNINWTIKTATNFTQGDQLFIKKYGINVLRGVLSEAEIDRLYGLADIFVYPSFVDINAMVINEALRAGLPVVATDTFGLVDKIKNHQNGLLIHDEGVFWNSRFMRTGEFDPKTYTNRRMSLDLYDKLGYLIKNDKERKRMGLNAENDIKKGFLSTDIRNKKLKEIFESAIR